MILVFSSDTAGYFYTTLSFSTLPTSTDPMLLYIYKTLERINYLPSGEWVPRKATAKTENKPKERPFCGAGAHQFCPRALLSAEIVPNPTGAPTSTCPTPTVSFVYTSFLQHLSYPYHYLYVVSSIVLNMSRICFPILCRRSSYRQTTSHELEPRGSSSWVTNNNAQIPYPPFLHSRFRSFSYVRSQRQRICSICYLVYHQ